MLFNITKGKICYLAHTPGKKDLSTQIFLAIYPYTHLSFTVNTGVSITFLTRQYCCLVVILVQGILLPPPYILQ